MRKINLAFLFFSLSILILACKKEIRDPSGLNDEIAIANASRVTPTGQDPPCREELQPDWIADTVEVPTQLGRALTGNPYSVAVMQQASMNLYGNSRAVVANKNIFVTSLLHLTNLTNSLQQILNCSITR